MNNINEKLRRVKEEDLIWIIYFFIVIGALMSNNYEKNYLLTGNTSNQKTFKVLNITLFVVAFFIYLYFVIQNYQDIKDIQNNHNRDVIITRHIAFIAAVLFLIGGVLQIIVEINRDTPDEDIGIV